MKKIAVLTVACSILAGCSYLGEPESYTVVDEVSTPVAAPQPAPAPVAAPVVIAQPATPCGCGFVRPGVRAGACQVNPGVTGPLVIDIPAQSVCVQ